MASLCTGVVPGCFKTFAELRRLPREMRRDTEARKEATIFARDELLPKLSEGMDKINARLDQLETGLAAAEKTLDSIDEGVREGRAALKEWRPVVREILAAILAILTLYLLTKRGKAIYNVSAKALRWKGGWIRKCAGGLLRWRPWRRSLRDSQ